MREGERQREREREREREGGTSERDIVPRVIVKASDGDRTL